MNNSTRESGSDAAALSRFANGVVIPARLGYRMPPEWCPHEATWLVWPKDPVTWPERVPQVEEIFLKMIECLTPHERVDLLVDDAETAAVARRRLRSRGVPEQAVALHLIRTVDCWIRDYGPNFLLHEKEGKVELAFNHWGFNAWGGKYEALKKDAVIPEQLAPIWNVPCFVPGMILEGGSIDVNGRGSCLTTEQCLLNPNRNPHLSQEEIEQRLKDYLGVEQIIWLGEGIAGDDTDGHIDDVARFVAPDVIVCALEEDRSDENYGLLQDSYRRLELARDLDGRPFQVVPLPMPGRVESPEGRLPASYANFYIANRVVLVPTFGHPNDRCAVEILQNVFPDRSVLPIHCEPLLWGLGALHCITQQQPARTESFSNSFPPPRA